MIYYLMIVLSLGEEAPLMVPYQNTHFPAELGAARWDDPTQSEGILITQRGKKDICAAQWKAERSNHYVAKTWTSENLPLFPPFRKANKKEKQKSAIPQLVTFPLCLFHIPVSHRTAIPHKLQVHKGQTDAYRAIPGKCPHRPDTSPCICSHHQTQRNKSCVVTVKISTMTKCRY